MMHKVSNEVNCALVLHYVSDSFDFDELPHKLILGYRAHNGLQIIGG